MSEFFDGYPDLEIPTPEREYTEKQQQELIEEHRRETLRAVRGLGVEPDKPPEQIPKVGTILLFPEIIEYLRVPYAIEVLGMPSTGKSSCIVRYLEEKWASGDRNLFSFVPEGVSVIKDQYGDMRYTDPFQYSLLGGSATFRGYLDALIEDANQGTRVVTSDRGQIDRRVFRRVFFQKGEVDAWLMDIERRFIYGWENTPIQMGGVIMMMARPEVSYERSGPEGPVNNMEFLPLLYNEYWRLHRELIKGEVPTRVYACIDAERSEDEVYARFKHAMDTAVNIHEIMHTAILHAYPAEVSEILEKLELHPRPKHLIQRRIEQITGGNVLIIGGDEMRTIDDFPVGTFAAEGYRVRPGR